MEFYSSETYSVLIGQFLLFLPKVVAAAIIFTVFVFVYRITHKPLEGMLKKTGLEEALIQLLIGNIYKLLVYIVGGVMAAGQLGINVGAALAGLGVAGLAIGFAAQDTLANIIAGFMIFFDKPFTVGDWIKVADNYGAVYEITLRSTRIKTLNNTYVVIPNKIIIDEVVNNHSKCGDTRVDVPLGIAYKEDIDQARTVLLEAIADVPHLNAQHPPDVVVEELGDSSVNLLVRVWTSDQQYEQMIHHHVLEASKKALDKAKIQIPFPHLQLHVDKVEPEVVSEIRG